MLWVLAASGKRRPGINPAQGWALDAPSSHKRSRKAEPDPQVVELSHSVSEITWCQDQPPAKLRFLPQAWQAGLPEYKALQSGRAAILAGARPPATALVQKRDRKPRPVVKKSGESPSNNRQHEEYCLPESNTEHPRRKHIPKNHATCKAGVTKRREWARDYLRCR